MHNDYYCPAAPSGYDAGSREVVEVLFDRSNKGNHAIATLEIQSRVVSSHDMRPRLGPPPDEPSRRSLKPSMLKASVMKRRFCPAPLPSCRRFWAAERCKLRVDGRFVGRRGVGKARRAAADTSVVLLLSWAAPDGNAWGAENWKTWCIGDMSASVVEASIWTGGGAESDRCTRSLLDSAERVSSGLALRSMTGEELRARRSSR